MTAMISDSSPGGRAERRPPVRSAGDEIMHGRKAEQQILRDLMRRAQRGLGAVVLVEGEPGIGKSLLLREAIDVAAGQGFSLAAAASDQLGNAIPFFVLRAALREPFAKLTADDPDHELPDKPAWWISQIQAHLEQRAAAVPVLVCLDDLHWAGPATLAALRVLPRELKRHPVAWILARSSTPQQDVEYLFSLLEKDGAARVTLAPLGDDAVAALLADAFGAPPDSSLLALACGAAGNPSLLTELIHGLRDDNAVHVTDDRAMLASAQLPQRIHRVAQQRLDGLSKQARHLLVTAAVLGPSFRLEDAAGMLGETPAALLPTIEEAIGAGIMTAAESAFSFRHQLLGRAVADMIPRPVRRAMHRQYGEILLNRGESPALVAGHLLQAAHAGDPASLAGLDRAAAETLRSSPQTAADLTLRALELTSPGDPGALSRSVAAAEALTAAGRLDQAARIARDTLAKPLPPVAEARLRCAVSSILCARGQVGDVAVEARNALAKPQLPGSLQEMAEQSVLEVGPRFAARAGDGAARRAMVAASVLRPPAARSETVARQALLDRLAESVAARLVLMVAPAGWGKTSLLRDWWLATQDSGAAWLSVRESDNDPVRFWSGVIAALGTVAPGTGASALEALTVPGATMPGWVETLLADDLARMPGRITLVLDDFHLITSPEVRAGFAFLVEHLPPTLSLVVAARCDPELPLARLRARGELAEIRAGQLGFTHAEAERLLNQTLGLALPPEEIHALWQRTEGWAAGLYLAGLSLRGRKDGRTAGFSGAFTGDDRHIFDYLAAEVLAGLPPRIHAFLLRTAVLGRFCASLCDAVTGLAGSQDLLEEIERRQLFLVPLDNARRWYCYHALFAEKLRRELDRTEPGLVPLLHRRASAWYRQHGTLAEAIEHAIAAGDLSDARELIAAHWHEVLDEGLAEVVEGWLDRLPPEMVIGDARMCLIRGLLAIFRGRSEDVEPWLAAAEAAGPQGPCGHGPASAESATCFYRALRRCLDGDLAAAESAGRRAAELELESGNAYWRARTRALLGAILFWRGQDADAGLLLKQVIRPAHRPTDHLASLLARSCMAAISARHGDYDAAGRYAREAADPATRHRVTVVADLTSADLLADRDELAAAETAALAALDHARHQRWRLDTAAALVCLARIYTRAGRAADARTRLDEASDLIATLPDPGILADLLAEAKRSAVQPEQAPAQRDRSRRPDGLTAREAEVLGQLTRGHTNLEIAAKLVVSVHTVERHLQNAYRKIRVRNRADAAAYMARDGS